MLATRPVLALPTVRPLTADDTATYRMLREEILAMGDGRYFSDSYEREARLSESQWYLWCTETPQHCIFGIFDRDYLIGVMMVTQYGEPADRKVEWEAIWLDPHYRRQGIARTAYRQIQQWTLDRGYDRVILYIRADNKRSQDIHRKQGARYGYTKHGEVWADGSIADAHVFTMDIHALTSGQNRRQTLRHLEESFSFLNREIPAVAKEPKRA
ncbi:MAG TPA: GNAT family N-acetyltransferase [Alphaproteobacteria bacterium]|nr:GNAT family N-acetyltransferase [Alphaproteobacteria bacterium]